MNMLLSILYESGLLILGLLTLPKLLYMLIVHKKYRSNLFKRFGRHFPSIDKGKRHLVWIHAVSVGETKAIAPLVKILKSELNNPLVVVSSVTETGHAEAMRSIPMPIIMSTCPSTIRLLSDQLSIRFSLIWWCCVNPISGSIS